MYENMLTNPLFIGIITCVGFVILSHFTTPNDDDGISNLVTEENVEIVDTSQNVISPIHETKGIFLQEYLGDLMMIDTVAIFITGSLLAGCFVACFTSWSSSSPLVIESFIEVPSEGLRQSSELSVASSVASSSTSDPSSLFKVVGDYISHLFNLFT